MSQDEEPVVVEYTDGSKATLPSAAEFQRMAQRADEQYEQFMNSPFGNLLSQSFHDMAQDLAHGKE